MDARALAASFIFHLLLVVLFVYGVPGLRKDLDMGEQHVITVELLSVAEVTNVKPRVAPKAPLVKEKDNAEQSSTIPVKPSLPDPALSKPKVSEVVSKPKVEVKQKPKISVKPIKPIEKPKEAKPKEVEQTVEDAFAAVLKTVDKIKEEETEVEDSVKADDLLASAENVTYKPGLPMTLSEKDAIRQQIMQHWTVMGGAKHAEDMIVTLMISLAKDGAVQGVEIKDLSRYQRDTFFKAHADSAVRAVRKSSPLKGLPEAKYDTRDGWRNLELTFDPREMLF